jgi:predicted HTH domain antitoxin
LTEARILTCPKTYSRPCRSPDEFARELRLAAAIHWYERGAVSQEKAAYIAGLDCTDFLTALAREQTDVFQVDFGSLRRELQGGG